MAAVPQETETVNPLHPPAAVEEGLVDHSSHNFDIDCGTRKVKFLSYGKALFEEHQMHPRCVAQDQPSHKLEAYSQWPLGTNFGWHHFDPSTVNKSGVLFVFLGVGLLAVISLSKAIGDPDGGTAPASRDAALWVLGAALLLIVGMIWSFLIAISELGKAEQQNREAGLHPTPLYEYGVGSVLHFKMLKFIATILLTMGCFALPSIVMFAGAEPDAKAGGAAAVSAHRADGWAVMALTTLGALGEAHKLCRASNTTQAEMTLRCPGSGHISHVHASFGTPRGHCGCPSVRMPVDGSTCPAGMQLGTEPVLGQPCCAPLPPAAQYSHVPVADRACDSSSAQSLVSKLCLGKASCRLLLNSTYLTTAGSNATVSFRSGLQPAVAAGGVGSGVGCPAGGGGLRLLVWAKCYESKVRISWMNRSLGKETLAYICVCLDVLGCFIFIVMVTWLEGEQVKEERHYDDIAIDCSDYSVMLKHIPAHDDVAKLTIELKAHLLKVLNSDVAKRHAKRLRGKKAQAKAVEIAQVHYAFDDADLIRAQRVRAKAKEHVEMCKHRMDCAQSLHNMHTTDKTQGELEAQAKSDPDHAAHLPRAMVRMRKKIERAKVLLERTDAKILRVIDRLDHESSSAKTRPGDDTVEMQAVACFITFASEEGKLRCMQEFPDAWLSQWRQHCCHRVCPCCSVDRRLKCAEGKVHTFKFIDPPMPSNIIWENMVVPKAEKVVRQLVVALLIAFALVLSWTVVVAMRYAKNIERNKYPTIACEPGASTKESVEVAYKAQGYMPTGHLSCFCKAHMDSPQLLSTRFDVTGTPGTSGVVTDQLCLPWLATQAKQASLTVGMAWFILIVNLVFTRVMRNAATFVRPRFVGDELEKTARYALIGMAVNTCLIPVLAHANFDSDAMAMLGVAGLYSDFSSAWYYDVGVLVMLVMLLNCFVPHFDLFVRLPLHRCRRCVDRGCSKDHTLTRHLTQHDLNHLFEGPVFDIAARSAQALNVVFVCLVFSSAMPLLYVFGVINIMVIYWVDKWGFLRLYRKPPLYNAQLAYFCSSYLQYAGLAHCMVGVWMFSNSSILQPEDLASRVSITARLSDIVGADVMSKSVVQRIFNSVGAAYIFAAFLVFLVMYLLLKVLVEDEFWWLVKQCRLQSVDYEHNPDYITTLPTEVLEDIAADPAQFLALPEILLDTAPEELHSLVLRVLQTRAKRASVHLLEGGADDLISTRQMVGLHSYDLKINPRYNFVVSENVTAVRAHIFGERKSNLTDMTEEDRSREIRRESVEADTRRHTRAHSLFHRKHESGEQGKYEGVKQEEEEEVVPAGWEKHLDAVSGFHYYYNTASGETRWEAPDGTGGLAAAGKKKKRKSKSKSKRKSKSKVDPTALTTAVAATASPSNVGAAAAATNAPPANLSAEEKRQWVRERATANKATTASGKGSTSVNDADMSPVGTTAVAHVAKPKHHGRFHL